MLDPESAAIAYPAGLDPARRLRMLADAYGLPLGDRVALVDAIRAADEAARAFVAARVQRGERAFLEAFTQQGGWVRRGSKNRVARGDPQSIDRRIARLRSIGQGTVGVCRHRSKLLGRSGATDELCLYLCL